MNKKYALGMFALLTVLVVGCTGDPTSSSTTTSSGTSQSNTTTSTGSENYLTNDDLERGKTTYVDDNGETQDLTINTLYTNANSPHLDPLKELHAMVVPFGFTDSDLQDVQSEANIERIRTVFFGDDEEIADVNGWISVADYYQTSSYGKSTFTGEVLPTWVVYNGTSSSFQRTYGTSLGVGAAEYARTWYINEYAKENHGSLGADAHDITWFDQNNDGYLDLVWVVYSHPTSQNDTNSWWAYVTYTGNNPNTASPTVKTLGWASIDWMNNSYGGYDPHTFIHETGHTYGLNDYYDYTNTWKPMGGVDMMDQNLGDHSAYSKFELGKGIQIGNGTDGTIFATGVTVQEALKARKVLQEKGINVRVVDMFSIKPIDKEMIIKCATETKKLLSIEDHNIIGGLGSAISEVLTDEYPTKLIRLGIKDTFGRSGKAEELMKYYGIVAENIIEEF